MTSVRPAAAPPTDPGTAFGPAGADVREDRGRHCPVLVHPGGFGERCGMRYELTGTGARVNGE
ncbi:hypothetical protein GCM10010335_45590 [Streptomyces galbus]|nr:hypothetical protein GCM10010335_45590 [Streptomyces galbus]